MDIIKKLKQHAWWINQENIHIRFNLILNQLNIIIFKWIDFDLFYIA